MTNYDAAVERYFEAWNTESPQDLEKTVVAAFTEDATYIDPLADVAGHEGLIAVIQGAHQQFAGFEFKLTGSPEGHHNIARFSWDLVSKVDGSSPAAGFDVITLAEDGRISSVKGFLDRLPSA